MQISMATKQHEASMQHDPSRRITAIFTLVTIIDAMLIFSICNTAAHAAHFEARKVQCQLHGGNPRGGDPKWQPGPDPDLPANQRGRDPYNGEEHNNKNRPNKPY